jgi:multidrug efflux pump subunit AcrA (membrane-fusion protein)
MLRLSGLSDDGISKLTTEAAINATLSVVAPRSATVVDIMISPGQRMEQTAPLIKLAQLSPLWVEIAVLASNIRAIRPGAKVEVDGYATPGQVVLVSETTDAATQTILVRAEVPNTGELRPGQTAQARIGFASSAESAWEVPYSALIRRGEQRRRHLGAAWNPAQAWSWLVMLERLWPTTRSSCNSCTCSGTKTVGRRIRIGGGLGQYMSS